MTAFSTWDGRETLAGVRPWNLCSEIGMDCRNHWPRMLGNGSDDGDRTREVQNSEKWIGAVEFHFIFELEDYAGDEYIHFILSLQSVANLFSDLLLLLSYMRFWGCKVAQTPVGLASLRL